MTKKAVRRKKRLVPRSKGCKFQVVMVYEGRTIGSTCAKSFDEAQDVVNEVMLPKMRRKRSTSDAFIEIRKVGGSFDSVSNLWPDDIWDD